MSNAATTEDEVRTRAIARVRDIVLQAVGDRQARVWLFGSQATGRARRSSDIDVAVEPLEPIPAGFFADLRERLDESLVPYQEAEKMLAMADDRSLTVHTYNQALAREIFARLANHGALLAAWIAAMHGGLQAAD